MGKSDSLADPVKFRSYIHLLPSCWASTRVSRVHCRMAAPACHPCYPGSPSIGSGSYRQDRCYGLPLRIRGRQLHCVFRGYIWVRSRCDPQVCSTPKGAFVRELNASGYLNTSLQLHGELPNSHDRTLTDKSYVLHGIHP